MADVIIHEGDLPELTEPCGCYRPPVGDGSNRREDCRECVPSAEGEWRDRWGVPKNAGTRLTAYGERLVRLVRRFLHRVDAGG
jgi:hypothetical protein